MAAINIPGKFFNHDAQAGGFFPETHTDPGFNIDKFISEEGKNYVIEGIRGTGKTHMLKMAYQECLKSFGKKRILPVYMSLAGVSEWVEKEMPLFRLHLYSHLVVNAITTVQKNRNQIELAGNSEALKKIKKFGQLFGFFEDENFDLLLEKIKSVHENLISQLTKNPSLIRQKVSESIESGASAKAGARGIGVIVNEKEKNVAENEIEYEATHLAHENASGFLVEFLGALKSILDHRYTLILLDECSEVKKEAQIEIFRLLKLIRGTVSSGDSENTAFFCATVYPAPSTYYPSRIHGDSFNFDIGQDATWEYLQLDELSDEYPRFFESLTRRRVSLLLERPIEKASHLDIFESERAFQLAAYMANGVSRRYLEILKHGYDRLCQRVDQDNQSSVSLISVRDIEEGAENVASSQILARSKLTNSDFEILSDIVNRITKRNRRNETENEARSNESKLPANVYFTVSRPELPSLGNLIVQGCLHDKGKSRLKKYYREEGSRGQLIMLDLAVAFQDGAIDRKRALEICISDLKKNAKSGFLWCQDFQLKIVKSEA